MRYIPVTGCTVCPCAMAKESDSQSRCMALADHPIIRVSGVYDHMTDCPLMTADEIRGR